MKKNVAIFASGSGSNAENIIRYFHSDSDVSFPLILSNKTGAYVHQRAKALGVPSVTFTKQELENGNLILSLLNDNKIDLIVLAGFLLKIPMYLITAYPNKIINIHPALLPKYGGKGMYGHYVHEAVVAAGEKESGITIHYVNEHYDEGNVIFQAKCELFPTDTAEDVAKKVHQLEYEYYPQVIRQLLKEM
jgi:phosphoribosylglycinamide formyltransferase-1